MRLRILITIATVQGNDSNDSAAIEFGFMTIVCAKDCDEGYEIIKTLGFIEN